MGKRLRKFNTELEMQKYWNSLNVSKLFYTECNTPLLVRSVGAWNRESGPDFRNAAIKLGDHKFKGDIEIHLRASDWFAHQHQYDSAYSNVILHVAGENDLTQEQRELLPPLLVLKISEDIEPGKITGKCADILYDLGTTKARELFLKAGAHRFKAKSKRFLRQVLIEGAEQSFRRFLFEAAGYKQNRPAFNALFKRFLSYPENIRETNFEDILWGESGLLPDMATDKIHPELKHFAKTRWNNWWRLRQRNTATIGWNPGGRPTNSPERRLAVLVNWLRRLGNTPLKDLGEYTEQHSPEQLVKHIVATLEVSDDLWDKYVNFNTAKNTPAKIGGRSFILEVAVNVVLPAIYALTELDILKDPGLTVKQLEKAWMLLPATQENSISGRAGELWFKDSRQKREILNSAAARQGLLHIYREYCEKCQSDCNSCKWL